MLVSEIRQPIENRGTCCETDRELGLRWPVAQFFCFFLPTTGNATREDASSRLYTVGDQSKKRYAKTLAAEIRKLRKECKNHETDFKENTTDGGAAYRSRRCALYLRRRWRWRLRREQHGSSSPSDVHGSGSALRVGYAFCYGQCNRVCVY